MIKSTGYETLISYLYTTSKSQYIHNTPFNYSTTEIETSITFRGLRNKYVGIGPESPNARARLRQVQMVSKWHAI